MREEKLNPKVILGLLGALPISAEPSEREKGHTGQVLLPFFSALTGSPDKAPTFWALKKEVVNHTLN